MPRKGRKYRKYLKGKIDVANVLGTLAANTLTSATVSGSVAERTYISSVDCAWSLADLTVVVDQGPITVGIAHSDYTDAEIEAFIENSGSWNEGNLTAQEVAGRKIRIVGTFSNEGVAAEAAQTAVLNDGEIIHTKCGWIQNVGTNIASWAYNTGAQPLTTGANVHVIGHANLWPR